MSRWRRAHVVRIYDHADELGIVRSDGSLALLSGASAEVVRVLLDFTREPRSTSEIFAHLSELSEEDAAASPAVKEALELLQATGALVDPSEAELEPPSEALGGLRVVVALSGGITAAWAPALGEVLLARGASVRFAATESALRFVSPLALAALSHAPVATLIWPDRETEPVPHLALTAWADAIVVYPATATTLARIANGDCSTVVSALALSARVPVLLVPAMNERMLQAPAVQRNLRQLRDDGFALAHPACGFEVASPPDQRHPSYGAAPPVGAVVDLLTALVHRTRGR